MVCCELLQLGMPYNYISMIIDLHVVVGIVHNSAGEQCSVSAS